MPKHESASLARQQPPASRAVTRRISPLEGRVKGVADETANRDQATSSHLHERQRRVDANCSMHHIRQSLDLSTYRGERMAEVDLGVDQAHPICKRSLYENLEGQHEAVVVDLRAEDLMAL